MGAWDTWIGRSEVRVDRVDEAKLAQWLATLDRGAPADGTAPQGFHWCLCTPDAPTVNLSFDGHPSRDESADSFLPPVTLPRRMWASSEVQFHEPLNAGDAVERRSRVISIRSKQGGSGELIFVEIEHETRAGTRLAVRERQTIVYREATPAKLTTPHGSGDAEPVTAQRIVRPSEALLFRYSALTFNSHRIHYDLRYATEEEGYAGIVVQGPLTATLLLDLARHQLGDHALERFAFRGVSPALAGEELTLTMAAAAEKVSFAATTVEGRVVMTASGSMKAR